MNKGTLLNNDLYKNIDLFNFPQLLNLSNELIDPIITNIPKTRADSCIRAQSILLNRDNYISSDIFVGQKHIGIRNIIKIKSFKRKYMESKSITIGLHIHRDKMDTFSSSDLGFFYLFPRNNQIEIVCNNKGVSMLCQTKRTKSFSINKIISLKLIASKSYQNLYNFNEFIPFGEDHKKIANFIENLGFAYYYFSFEDPLNNKEYLLKRVI